MNWSNLTVYNISPIAARWEENNDTFSDINQYTIKKVYTAQAVIAIVCDFLNANRDDVCFNGGQYRECVYARFVCIYFLKRKTLLSVNSIAGLFKSKRLNAKRDHSIVTQGIKSLRKLMDAYDLVKNQIYSIEQMFI